MHRPWLCALGFAVVLHLRVDWVRLQTYVIRCDEPVVSQLIHVVR